MERSQPSRRGFLAGFLAALELLAHGPAHGQSGAATSAIQERLASNGLDFDRVNEILQKLKAAFDGGNLELLRSISARPLQVNASGSTLLLSTPEDFARHRALLMSNRLKRVVAASELDGLFINDQGAMLGDGDIWIGNACSANDCKSFYIAVKTINVIP